MDSLAARAARHCRPSSRPSARVTEAKRPWKRAPRTRAAATVRLQAIEAAITILRKAGIAFSEPLPGKLVIEPPPRVITAHVVTFWPARERLTLGRRPTQRGQDIHAFEQVLADQGHRIAGHPYRVPKSDAFLRFERAQAERKRRWLEQQVHLEEATSAIDECIALSLQRLRDFATSHRMDGENPQLREAKRRFRTARRRAMRTSGGS
jgi:hypothetical protein